MALELITVHKYVTIAADTLLLPARKNRYSTVSIVNLQPTQAPLVAFADVLELVPLALSTVVPIGSSVADTGLAKEDVYGVLEFSNGQWLPKICQLSDYTARFSTPTEHVTVVVPFASYTPELGLFKLRAKDGYQVANLELVSSTDGLKMSLSSTGPFTTTLAVAELPAEIYTECTEITDYAAAIHIACAVYEV